MARSQGNVLYWVLLGVLLVNLGGLLPAIGDLLYNPHDVETEFEQRLAPVVPDLPKDGIVSYYNCDDEVRKQTNGKTETTLEMKVDTGLRHFFASEYVLCPRILKLLDKPGTAKLCVCLSSDPARAQAFARLHEMQIRRDYGRGVYLLEAQ